MGGALGLSHPRLTRMTQLPSEMVASWLNEQDDVLSRSGKPTWNRLADALKEIGQTGIAVKIRQTKCPSTADGVQQQIPSLELDSSRGIYIYVTAHA